MACAIADDADQEGVFSAINTTPLVDVMLVLLIIFLITIPVVAHTVPLDLPKAANRPQDGAPETVRISVTRDGKVFWNEQAVAGRDDLLARLKRAALASRAQPPEVQIRGDAAAPYEFVGRVVVACQRAGIAKIGFVTEPPARG